MTPPRLSVVIPAYNAEATLDLALASVFASQRVDFEVLVVNDASTDRTEAIARRYPCRVVSLAQNIMSANCRNLGAELAQGEILVFFDSDQVMTPDTLRLFEEALDAHPNVAAVVGSLAPDTRMPGFFSRFKNFHHHFTHQTADLEGATLASGLAAIRRQVFLAEGGFEPAFSGASIEDIALGYRLRRAGHRIRFTPHIQMEHLKAYTFRTMLRSDIVHRAIPWTGLMLRERIFRSDLNTRGGNVLSVALAWLILPALLAGAAGRFVGAGVGTLGLATALVSVAVLTLLNLRFLTRASRTFGAWFALRAAAFLPVMYFYHGVGLIAGIVAYLAGGSVAAQRVRPSPRYRLYEPSDPARPADAGPQASVECAPS